MERVRPDGFLVTDDQERMDIERVHQWLSEGYWAAGRSMELVSKSIRCSVTLGCFAPDGVQVVSSDLSRTVPRSACYPTSSSTRSFEEWVLVAFFFRQRSIILSPVVSLEYSCAPTTLTGSISVLALSLCPVRIAGWSCALPFPASQSRKLDAGVRRLFHVRGTSTACLR